MPASRQTVSMTCAMSWHTPRRSAYASAAVVVTVVASKVKASSDRSRRHSASANDASDRCAGPQRLGQVPQLRRRAGQPGRDAVAAGRPARPPAAARPRPGRPARPAAASVNSDRRRDHRQLDRDDLVAVGVPVGGRPVRRPRRVGDATCRARRCRLPCRARGSPTSRCRTLVRRAVVGVAEDLVQQVGDRLGAVEVDRSRAPATAGPARRSRPAPPRPRPPSAPAPGRRTW